MMKRYFKKAAAGWFLVVFIFCQPNTFAQVSMLRAPLLAYDHYFSYFSATSPNLPPGAAIVSKGTMGIIYTSPPNMAKSATAFLIQTFRNDNKICACTSGHTINSTHTLTNLDDNARGVKFIAYMNYTGRANAIGLNQTLSGTVTILNAEVKAHFYSPLPDGVADIGLILINKSELAVSDYALLPYEFDNPDNDTSSTFYTEGHPFRMALRIASGHKMIGYEPNYITTRSTSLANNGGEGMSGGPFIRVKPNGSWSVIGAQSHLRNPQLIPHTVLGDLYDPGRTFEYSSTLLASKIKALEAAIKQHCWQTKTPEELMSSGAYKQAAIIDNSQSRADFEPVKSITSTAGLKRSADQAFGTDNSKRVLIKASTLSISYPIVFDDDINSIYTLATTTNLLPGFSCTATGDKVFEANVVVLEPLSVGTAAARSSYALPVVKDATTGKLPKTAAATGFKIMPNPSTTGIFQLITPTDKPGKKYKITVTTTDGKQVLQKMAEAGNNIEVNLSGKARGEYILSLYESNRVVYQAQLVH